MAMKEKYINPFRPKKLQEKIFSQLFEQAEIAQYNKEESKQYEESLKYYRDLKNTVDTAHSEGKIEGILEGKIEGKIENQVATVINFYSAGATIELIMQGTGLSAEEIKVIIGENSK